MSRKSCTKLFAWFSWIASSRPIWIKVWKCFKGLFFHFWKRVSILWIMVICIYEVDNGKRTKISKCVPKCCLSFFFFFFLFFFFFFNISSKLIEKWDETVPFPGIVELFFLTFFSPLTVMLSSCRKCILIREKIVVPRMMIYARLKFSLPLQGD